MPIALVEPIRSNLIQHGGSFYNAPLAVAVKMGLPLAAPTGTRLAAGWMFGPRHRKWELLDPMGALIGSLSDEQVCAAMVKPAQPLRAFRTVRPPGR
jgi:hypothetical protein